jgi:hypothetical protein
MIRYRYASGDLILARRNTEEWIRWVSEAEMLMLELPDATFQDIADAAGTNKIEIAGTLILKVGGSSLWSRPWKRSKQAGFRRAGFFWKVLLRLLPQHSCILAASSADH